MKVAELYEFVSRTDVAKTRDADSRRLIATLGLVSEIGSVLSALKKDLLSDNNETNAANRFLIRGQVKEEIGDALWYAIMLAQCQEDPIAKDIFRAGLERLQFHLTGASKDNKRTQKQLKEAVLIDFLKDAGALLDTPNATVDVYQRVMYQTRRTEGLELKKVCSAVLQQLAAQLSRDLLPDKELILNHAVHHKHPVKALGEILWHISAIASVYDLKLSECVKVAVGKSEFRNVENKDGPDHFENDREEDGDRFPDSFEVHFLDNDGVANMYWVQDDEVIKRIGNKLRDNNYFKDGYRFHDVMHVAFATFLRWSPNLRSFMGLKRKKCPQIDEVEDGGRAKILEEAVILIVHQQAKTYQEYLKENTKSNQGSPYSHESALNFEFLRSLRAITEDHEVFKNPKQDWEKAIVKGYELYADLTSSNGGIIEVDISNRTLAFKDLSSRTSSLDYDNPKIPDED